MFIINYNIYHLARTADTTTYVEGKVKNNKLFNQAKINIGKLKIKNAIYKLGNGVNGWGEEILFDAIIVSAASEKIPLRLLQNLKNYGSLIIPKKYPSGNQKLILIKKTSKNDFDQKELFDVKFVPLLNTNIEY